MKLALIFALTLSCMTAFGKAERMAASTGESLGNSQNTCVGCALRAAQIDQENRRAGKEFAEKKNKASKGRFSGARTDV